MKAVFYTGALILVLSGLSAVAAPGPEPVQTNKLQPLTRTYDGRIEMHQTPMVARPPTDEKTASSLMEALGLKNEPEVSASARPGPGSLPSRAAATRKKDKNRQWIRPGAGTPDSQTGTRFEEEEEEEEGSGWGWLADDVKSRQDQRKSQAEDSEAEETKRGREAPVRPAGTDSSINEPWMVGSGRDRQYTPVSTAPASRESAAASSPADNSLAGTSPVLMPGFARGVPGVPSPSETAPTPGRSWGSDPAAGAQPDAGGGVLKQTAALLPKPDIGGASPGGRSYSAPGAFSPTAPLSGSYSPPAAPESSWLSGGLGGGGGAFGASAPSPYQPSPTPPPSQPSSPWSAGAR